MDKVRKFPKYRTQGAKLEIGAISKTLGIKLLEEVAAVYSEAARTLHPLKCSLDEDCMAYDMSKPITEVIGSLSSQTSASRHIGFHDMVEEIKNLQTKLDGTQNEDDQLALEEDITGRILWACHSGLRSTVGHTLAKVLNSILKDDKVYHLMDRVKFLEQICRVFNDALAELPTDDQAHLRR
ncbi:hypothetical protein EDC04DRAFT_634551 [Pisolithus marmoratus]|nr:hypothetical protein EDC04DRAFT_634551 [Pisolithus marmoratus]